MHTSFSPTLYLPNLRVPLSPLKKMHLAFVVAVAPPSLAIASRGPAFEKGEKNPAWIDQEGGSKTKR